MAHAKTLSASKKATKKISADTTSSSAPNATAILGAILLVTAIVFANSIGNNFIINWDDDGYIMNNPLIKELSWQGLKTIFTVPHLDNYHPLTTLSNAIELNLFGMNPQPFHVVNLLLHLLNTWLVFRFIKSLSGRIEVAAITALFFGIHPMHVESVSWLSERKDLLYSFFFLASLIYYHRYITDKKTGFLVSSLLLFLCSLLSKPAAVALSPILFIIDYYVGRKITIHTLLEKIPFFVLSIFFGILAVHIQQSSGSTNLAPVFPSMDKIFLVCYAIVFYLIKLIAPFNLSAIHLYPDIGALTWEYYVAPFIIFVMMAGIYKAKSFRNELIFGLLFFIINIALVIQIIPVGRAIVAERYTYIPYIGLFFIIGKCYCWIMDDTNAMAQKIKPTVRYVIGGLTILFLVITWNRNKVWKDSYTLFSAAIETNPDDYYGYFTRARGALLMGDNRAALADYSKVIQLRPSYAEGYYSRGVVNEKINVADAINDYTTAIRLSPKHENAFYNRGNLKIAANDYQGAILDYDTTLTINAKNAQAFCNRGAAKFNLGNMKEAINDYSKAIQLNPELSNAYSNRGNAELNTGDTSTACNDWHKAVEYGFVEAQKSITLYCK